MNILLLLIVILLLTNVLNVYALVKVFLNDGTILQGELLNQFEDSIELEINFNIVIIQKSEILSIDNLPDQHLNIYLTNGDIKSGKLISQDSEKIKIQDSVSNQHVISRNAIDHIDWREKVDTDHSRGVPEEKIIISKVRVTNKICITNELCVTNRLCITNRITNVLYIEYDQLLDSKKLYVRAMLLSMLLPSFGQFRKGQKLKGILILSTEIAMSGLAIATYSVYRNKKKVDSISITEYDKITGWKYSSFVFLGLSVLCYSFNILDALFYQPDNSNVSMIPYNQENLAINEVSYRFNFVRIKF